MSTIFQKKSGVYQLGLMIDSKQRLFSLGTRDAKEAYRKAQEIESKYTGKSIKQLFEFWVDNKPIHLSKNHIQITQRAINNLLEFTGNIPAKIIDEKALFDFWKHLEKQYTISSISMKLKSIKSVFSFAYRRDLITRNPFKNFQIPKAESRKEYLTPDECKILLDAVDNELYKCYISFFLSTGCRRQEFALLRWTDIKERYIEFNGKGQRRRFPNTNIIKRILDDIDNLQIKKIQYVFTDNDGNYLGNHDGMTKIVKRYIKRSHLDERKKINLCAHSLRHTFATNLLVEKNYPITKVSKLLGHKSIRTTEEHYAHILPEFLDVDLDYY